MKSAFYNFTDDSVSPRCVLIGADTHNIRKKNRSICDKARTDYTVSHDINYICAPKKLIGCRAIS